VLDHAAHILGHSYRPVTSIVVCVCGVVLILQLCLLPMHLRCLLAGALLMLYIARPCHDITGMFTAQDAAVYIAASAGSMAAGAKGAAAAGEGACAGTSNSSACSNSSNIHCASHSHHNCYSLNVMFATSA
jgi:hypothetical protein